MRQARLVPVKHGLSSLMVVLKEEEIKAEDVPVHMHHEHTETKHIKDKSEIPPGTVNAGHINKITTLPLPAEGDWKQATSEDNYLRYIKSILSSPEEKPIEPK